jgi:hypothetical protein
MSRSTLADFQTRKVKLFELYALSRTCTNKEVPNLLASVVHMLRMLNVCRVIVRGGLLEVRVYGRVVQHMEQVRKPHALDIAHVSTFLVDLGGLSLREACVG